MVSGEERYNNGNRAHRKTDTKRYTAKSKKESAVMCLAEVEVEVEVLVDVLRGDVRGEWLARSDAAAALAPFGEYEVLRSPEQSRPPFCRQQHHIRLQFLFTCTTRRSSAARQIWILRLYQPPRIRSATRRRITHSDIEGRILRPAFDSPAHTTSKDLNCARTTSDL